jgi:hypothetical protein
MADIPVNKSAHPFDKTRFDALLNRRFFYAPAFEIYGGAFTNARFQNLFHSPIHSSSLKVSRVYMITAPPARLSRQTSSQNGASTSS